MNRLIGGILTVIAIAILIGAAVATRFRPAENSNNLVESTTGSTSPGTNVEQNNQGARSRGFNQPGATGRTGTTGQTGTTGTTGQTGTTGTTGNTGQTSTGARTTSQPATTGQPGTETVPATTNPVGAGSKPPDSTGTTPATPPTTGSGAVPARW